MKFEVLAPQLGRVHLCEIRAALGSRFEPGKVVRIAILNPRHWPMVVRIELIDHEGRTLLKCPLCQRARMVLRTAELDRLGCNTCVRHMRRREKERTCRSWQHLDGSTEDELVRMALSSTPANLKADRMALLARRLVAGDHDRAGASLQYADAATSVADEVIYPAVLRAQR